MRKLKVLNLYAGLGGNRKKWKNVDVTAIEIDEKIAAAYQQQHKNDKVIIADAHQYLLDHYSEFDVTWGSPPCQGNSKFILSGRNRRPRYPDLKLYEEVLFLKYHYKGLWVIENVIPYYTPLMEAKKIGRHLFWSNFKITDFDPPKFPGFMSKQNVGAKKELQDWLDIHYDGNLYYGKNHCVTQVLRNCVHPDLGDHVFKCAVKSL